MFDKILNTLQGEMTYFEELNQKTENRKNLVRIFTNIWDRKAKDKDSYCPVGFSKSLQSYKA